MMKSASVKKKGLPLAERLHRILFPNEDKRKVKKLVESRGFDMFIMSVILVDAAVLGLLSRLFLRIIGSRNFLFSTVCLWEFLLWK